MGEATYGRQAVEVRPVIKPNQGKPGEGIWILVQLPNGFVIVQPEDAIDLAKMITEVAQDVIAMRS